MITALTPSQGNYLEWICRFGKNGPVRVSDLAQKLGVSLPSVCRAVRALAAAGLVWHPAYGQVEPTSQGRRLGEAIIRRDELLTCFLTEVLAMSREEADPCVNQLEHVLEENLLLRLEILVRFLLKDRARMQSLRQEISGKLRHGESLTPVVCCALHGGAASEKQR